MKTIEITNTGIIYNGKKVGVMELNTQKLIMKELGCNEHYQNLLKNPSIRIYGALLDTIRAIQGIPTRTYAGTLIFG